METTARGVVWLLLSYFDLSILSDGGQELGRTNVLCARRHGSASLVSAFKHLQNLSVTLFAPNKILYET